MESNIFRFAVRVVLGFLIVLFIDCVVTTTNKDKDIAIPADLYSPSELKWHRVFQSGQATPLYYPCRILASKSSKQKEHEPDVDSSDDDESEEEEVQIAHLLFSQANSNKEPTIKSVGWKRLFPYHGRPSSSPSVDLDYTEVVASTWCPSIYEQYAQQQKEIQSKSYSPYDPSPPIPFDSERQLQFLQLVLAKAKQRGGYYDEYNDDNGTEDREGGGMDHSHLDVPYTQARWNDDDLDSDQEVQDYFRSYQQSKSNTGGEGVTSSSSSPSTNTKKKEPMRRGDVVEYYSPIFCFGDERGKRTSTVVAIDPSADMVLKLANGDYLGKQDKVKRVKVVVPERIKRKRQKQKVHVTIVDHPGIFREIQDFNLMKGKEISSAGLHIQTQQERLAQVLKTQKENLVRKMNQSGFAPVDMLNDYRGSKRDGGAMGRVSKCSKRIRKQSETSSRKVRFLQTSTLVSERKKCLYSDSSDEEKNTIGNRKSSHSLKKRNTSVRLDWSDDTDEMENCNERKRTRRTETVSKPISLENKAKDGYQILDDSSDDEELNLVQHAISSQIRTGRNRTAPKCPIMKSARVQKGMDSDSGTEYSSSRTRKGDFPTSIPYKGNTRRQKHSLSDDSSSDEEELELIRKMTSSPHKIKRSVQSPRRGDDIARSNMGFDLCGRDLKDYSSLESQRDMHSHPAKDKDQSVPMNLTNDSDDDFLDRMNHPSENPVLHGTPLPSSDSDDESLLLSPAFQTKDETAKERKSPCTSSSSSTSRRYRSILENSPKSQISPTSISRYRLEDHSIRKVTAKAKSSPSNPLYSSARKISPSDDSSSKRKSRHRSNLLTTNNKKTALTWNDSCSDSDDSIRTRLRRQSRNQGTPQRQKASLAIQKKSNITPSKSKSLARKPYKSPLTLHITKYNGKPKR